MFKFVLYALAGGFFYVKTMFKMGNYKPIAPSKRSNVALNIVGYVLIVAALLCLYKGLTTEPTQPFDIIRLLESASILLGIAVYFLSYKKSSSSVTWKVLKILYAVLLTLAYLGWEANLLSVLVYCLLLSCVYWRFSFKKKKKTQEAPPIDLEELKNKKIIDSSPYHEQWQKDIDAKSIEELEEIVNNRSRYNVEFAKMALERLTELKS